MRSASGSTHWKTSTPATRSPAPATCGTATSSVKQLADLERSATLSRLPEPLAGVTPESWWSLQLEHKHAVIGSLLKIEVQLTHEAALRQDGNQDHAELLS
jgi:hypothetical protein